MIEIPMRYKVKFAKMINKLQIELELDRQNQHGEKRETQIRNIKNEKVKYCTDVTMLKRQSPSAVYLKLSQHFELAILQYKIKSSIKLNKKGK